MNESFSQAKHDNPPYQPLGVHLRQMRERLQESVAEVSGAVEIDIADLERIEAGHDRPAEDILLLLINHFDVQDQEAIHLWELAGYEEPPVDNDEPDRAAPGRSATLMVVALDVRTLYTDSAQVVANDAGVVMQFSQAGLSGKQPIPVARVGMSFEQAQQVIENLQRALLQAKYLGGPKRLPPSTQSGE